MTYVHVDDEGKREIRISDNNIEHLMVTTGTRWYGEYAKLSYVVDSHYQALQNSLPKEENNKLQQAAQTVETRYQEHKKRVL